MRHERAENAKNPDGNLLNDGWADRPWFEEYRNAVLRAIACSKQELACSLASSTGKYDASNHLFF